MGLSASQAKLLSITARISDNELRSQSITAAKMALANRTSEASATYIDALNSTELIYSTYDLDGNKTSVDLTGTQLSAYAPLKTQYGLVNTKGQILISETDAANYEASETVNDFLAKYGVDAVDTGETQTVKNPAYDDAYEKYKDEYDAWMAAEPDKTDDKYWSEVQSTDSKLYETFKTASAGCYSKAMGGSSGCYLHVLAHMLDLTIDDLGKPTSYPKDEYKTSTGQSISIPASKISGSNIYLVEPTQTPNMVPVSDAIRDGWNEKTVYAAERDANNTKLVSDESVTLNAESARLVSDYYLQQGTPTEAQKLLSNYTYDSDGNITLKTLEQKCVDLYYVLENYSSLGIDYNTTLKDMLRSFQDDMSLAFTENVFDQVLYDNDHGVWEEEEPELTVPPTIEEKIYEYSDKDKAQWYVNLWHRINGESDDKTTESAGKQTSTEIHATEDENGEIVINKTTTTSSKYDVLEDGLMNSSEWLQYALDTGAVTLERVNYTNPTEEGTGLEDATWTSIVYTNALDISEQTDDAAIAKAEAEYEATTKDIESKDKQYDSMLKLLDTEHSALETEYESVKTVISKNTERTLKMYSA